MTSSTPRNDGLAQAFTAQYTLLPLAMRRCGDTVVWSDIAFVDATHHDKSPP